MRLSSWEGRAEAVRKAKIYVAMSAGIIKGALARLGLNGTISAEVTSLPQCMLNSSLLSFLKCHGWARYISNQVTENHMICRFFGFLFRNRSTKCMRRNAWATSASSMVIISSKEMYIHCA